MSCNLTTDQLPNVGFIVPGDGLDTPSLSILAGLNKSKSPFQIEHHFKLALDELNIILPYKRQAALEYALVTKEVLEEKKYVIQGT